MNKTGIQVVVFLLIIVFSSFADDNKEDIQSLKEERLETIKYGIDSQVTDLIKQLEIEKDFDFNEEFLELLKVSINNRLDQNIINLYKLSDDDRAVEFIFQKLQDDFNLSDKNRISYIEYISKYQTPEITGFLKTLIDEESNSVSIAAISALGKSESKIIIPELIEYLQDPLIDDLRKPVIVEALGKLKAEEALETVTDLATDIYSNNKSLRWKAVVALGDIGAEESLPVLESLFSDNDPYLRNYTLTAIKNFPLIDIQPILIQGLKDSSWRVRVNAAESLGELKVKAAVSILIYKSKNDPDIKNVRTATLSALGEIGGKEAFDFIRELYVNDRTILNLRNISISILAEKDLSNSLKTIKELISEEWDKSNTNILDYTCKILSTTKSSSLKELYKKMLGYDKNINLKLYALRGIRLNSISSLKDDVELLTGEDNPNSIRKLAIDVLKDI